MPWRRSTPPGPVPPGVAECVRERAQAIEHAAGPEIGSMYEHLMLDTWRRTLRRTHLGLFVVTGDIPAMWLRDSSLQMRPWLELACACPGVADTIAELVRTQWRLIARDPYANAFCHRGITRHLLDLPPARDLRVWERKYELDSLGLPVLLAVGLHQATGRTDHLDAALHAGLRTVVELWCREQRHRSSPYRFVRLDALLLGHRLDTLPRRGRGRPVADTGMTWQGFRPSDDACSHGYNVAAQLLASRALRHGAAWCDQLWTDPGLARQARDLAAGIEAGVELFGVADGRFAYEVDGLGGVLLADDANMPSLLSLPLLSDVAADDPRYLATREFVLSPANPWWHEGSAASGIGSPHTPGRRVWPIALAVQGLTTTDGSERLRIARLLAATTGGTGRMHESFHADDPGDFTRGWFSWADMMFCELASSLAPPADSRGDRSASSM